MRRHTGKMMREVQRPKVRLFVDAALAADRTADLRVEQAHYLGHVMRLGPGAEVAAFNGRDGEWRAVVERDRRNLSLRATEQLRPQTPPPDLWLLFAPIKRARIDFLAEKATELGVSVLQPVLTERTDVERVNTERLAAHAIEAAEQCGRLSVPEVREPIALGKLFDGWTGRAVWLALPGAPPAAAAPTASAVLIGPEGGFAPDEVRWLGALPHVVPVGLGPRVLRAETAAIAALTLLQAQHGDLGRGVAHTPFID
jgi:16S rRNA (uracil1498-N3)-methyltransferase